MGESGLLLIKSCVRKIICVLKAGIPEGISAFLYYNGNFVIIKKKLRDLYENAILLIDIV